MIPSLRSLGSRETAEAVALRAEREIPGYRRFLDENGFSGGPFEARPLMDKGSYVLKRSPGELRGGDTREVFTYFRSGGSSGHPILWPQLRDSHEDASSGFQRYLEWVFRVDRRPTLIVVACSLGSWIGGVRLAWMGTNVALHAPYPLSIFTPGSNHGEVIEALRWGAEIAEQILVILCPSAIGRILRRAEEEGIELPLAKIRYAATGESFPESMRAALQEAAGVPDDEMFMTSLYGAAETSGLGAESLASATIRKVLHRYPEVGRALGWTGAVPSFLHHTARESYLEIVDGTLVVTRWQGHPIVRYDLHDKVTFHPFAGLRDALVELMPTSADARPLRKVLEEAPDDLPEVIALSGRADKCLILCGTNLTEYEIDAAIATPELQALVSAAYRARIVYSGHRQHLQLDLELRGPPPADPEEQRRLEDRLYRLLVAALGREQPEFLDDWRNVYSRWDSNPDLRVIRLRLHPWPELTSSSDAIKHIGVIVD